MTPRETRDLAEETQSMSPRMRWIVLGLLGLVVLVLILTNRTGSSQVADEVEQWHLRKVAESIYEYHALTGKWPGDAEDLRKTSLAQLPYDIPMIQNGQIVVLWSQDLKPHPSDNARRLLVYSVGGPLRYGWKWVCWGDFRMEYLNNEQIQAALQAGEK